MPKGDKFINDVKKDLGVIASKEIPPRVVKAMNRAKKRHIRDVMNSKVVKELLRGPSGSSSFISEGDLYSFFGFDNINSISYLEVFLEQRIIIKVPKKVTNFEAINFVKYPDYSDFESGEFQLPWGIGSWVNRVESGIPFLSRYVSLRNKGRSFGGLQLEGERKSRQNADFKGFPFISKYRGLFANNLSKITL